MVVRVRGGGLVPGECVTVCKPGGRGECGVFATYWAVWSDSLSVPLADSSRQLCNSVYQLVT